MKVFNFFFIVSLFFLSCKNQDTTSRTVDTSSSGAVYQRLNNADFKMKLAETQNAQLVDVRTPREYEKGNITGAKLINFKDNNFNTEINKLDKNRPVLVYCQAGGRSASACDQMVKDGFKEIYELKNGYGGWE